MTTLTLDPSQRLQIIAMLDRLECPGRREAWAVCALQYKLDLDDEERKQIGYRKQRDDQGREFALWNGAALPPRTYELENADVKRISDALDKYPVILARDRVWWESLNAQVVALEELNGSMPVRPDPNQRQRDTANAA